MLHAYINHLSFLSFFFYFSLLFHERIFPGGFQLFVFSHLPSFPVHILLVCFSLSISFFIVLDATFALIYTAPSDFFFFFPRPSTVSWNFCFLLFLFSSVPSSCFLFVRRLYRSLSIPRRSRCRFLYCICSPVFSLLSCSDRGPDAFPGFPRT